MIYVYNIYVILSSIYKSFSILELLLRLCFLSSRSVFISIVSGLKITSGRSNRMGSLAFNFKIHTTVKFVTYFYSLKAYKIHVNNPTLLNPLHVTLCLFISFFMQIVLVLQN